jgi:rubrerythrin
MFNIKQYRAKAAEYGALSNGGGDPAQMREYKKLSNSFGTLAENEEWLADNFNKTLQSPDEEQSGRAALAAEEEHVLRCLGASVIMQWNAIPTKLRRELFDTAGSMGELLATAELRGQIARFLHKHKDDL